MVGAGGGCKIGEVAIDTIISNPVKSHRGFGFMAIGTGSQGVRADEGKSVVLVQFGNIVYQPVLRIMAPGAVFPDGSVVHIGVAGNTIGAGIRKNHGFVAGPAIHPYVLAGERKIGFGVAEFRRIPANLPARCSGEYGPRAVPRGVRYFPTGRRVAVGTIDLELSAVRGL